MDEYEWIVVPQLFAAGVQTLEEVDHGLLPPDHGSTFAEPQQIPQKQTHFRFYTDSEAFRDQIIQQFPQYEWNTAQEEARDWDLWWRERQTPVQVSSKVWVRPPWVEHQPADESEIVLSLEAKSAFGTGEHESTSLITELMEELDLTQQKFLDVGTGTGILAMIAEKRGAQFCLFTEIDPLTIPCIHENLQTNQCQRIQGFLGGLECIRDDQHFDVIVCNMIRSEMWPLRADLFRILKPGGFLLLSGQLASEQEPIIKWFEQTGLAFIHEKIRNEWWAVSARKRL